MKHLLAVIVMAACGTPEPARPIIQSPTAAADAAPAVEALQRSKLTEALKIATEVLAKDGGNSRAAAVRALVTYQSAGNDLIIKLTHILDSGEELKFLDHEAGRQTWTAFLETLEAVDRDLAIAGSDPAFSLELCLACWEIDWNRNGQIDDRDRKLFEVEYDAKDNVIDQADPGRRPTFRFDAGDVDWARAMIAFQRAGVELILAYKWGDLDRLLKFNIFGSNRKLGKITIKLSDPDRVKHARQLILTGIAFSDKSREAYLAETDDDREWVPNPKQRNHPLPLPMDASIYATWAAVTSDVRGLLESKAGLSLKQVMGIVDEQSVALVPDAYIDFGAMLREPKDIVFNFASTSKDPAFVEEALKGFFGNGYRTNMKPSPLVMRLSKMKDELERGSDTFDRKLSYLLWIN